MDLKDKKYLISVTLVILFLFQSCTKTKGLRPPPPEVPVSSNSEYATIIKPFIISKCALSSCHVANFPFGDFTTYGDLKTRINNGKINTLVFDLKLMPPANAVQLTIGELEKFKSWIDNGATEN